MKDSTDELCSVFDHTVSVSQKGKVPASRLQDDGLDQDERNTEFNSFGSISNRDKESSECFIKSCEFRNTTITALYKSKTLQQSEGEHRCTALIGGNQSGRGRDARVDRGEEAGAKFVFMSP
ncbi:hypothetical protein EYF80_053071 [Liparis tanakae]|uniref:Uncharacterized protein n=1 Tax=Liparis tanakae TaxID=230148 RepID=A0A4Z2F789_9TELE|nr:hypothetical protein EYF80_053071 [Liparis tanakae]